MNFAVRLIAVFFEKKYAVRLDIASQYHYLAVRLIILIISSLPPGYNLQFSQVGGCQEMSISTQSSCVPDKGRNTPDHLFRDMSLDLVLTGGFQDIIVNPFDEKMVQFRIEFV